MKTITAIGVTLTVVLGFMVSAEPVLAVDDLGLFELDANAVQDGSIDDWQTLYLGGGDPAVFTGIVPDPGVQTIFVGGRKDIQDIGKWGWKDVGGFPDKDDLTNAYAAAYVDDGNLIVYFGTDRFANKGDAYLAFWFFQDQVSLLEDGTFDGVHEVNDVLILVNYPQGAGSTPLIDVVEWNPAEADVAKNLKLVASGVECAGTGGLACAITNAGDQQSPWPYTPKDGTPGIFPYESFYEGGVNLTEILGWTPCFGSFMAESRSSESFTATLKDFVLGDFPVCGISVSKVCQVLRLTDDSNDTDKFFVVSFEGIVTNTGAGDFPAGAILEVVDDAGTPNDVSDDVFIQEVLADDLEPGESVPFSGEFFTNDNPPYNKVRASITFSNTTIEADPYGVECTSLPLNPALSLTKDCEVELATATPPGDDPLLAVVVDFNGVVCNTGDVPLTVTVTDDAAGVVFGPTLMAAGDCNTITGYYLPTQASGGVTNPCDAFFSDTFTAVGTSEIPDVNDQEEVITANCPLCDCPD